MGEGFTSYVVDNQRRFNAALQRVSFDIKDLRIPLTLISKDFYKSERAIFQLKSPGLYQDLADSTKRDRRRRKQPIYPILVRTGRLQKSVTDPESADAVCRIENQNTLFIGTRVPYAGFHQSDQPRKKIPLRQFLFIGPESRFASSAQKGRLERWLNILEGFYREKLTAVGVIQRNG